MNILRKISLLVAMLMSWVSLRGQDVIVTVMPVQEILPPQVMLYLSTPEKYFNVTLTNTSAEDQNVYLGLSISQIVPQTDLRIITPPRRQPARPIVVPSGGNYQLTMYDMKHLFDHIPANEISAPANLFENYTSGSFGMLPEGQYEVRITAYHWDPTLQTPPAVSSPMGGVARFTVCYTAQSPIMLAPIETMGAMPGGAASLDMANPLFTWTQPIVTCNPRAVRYKYSLRIVQLMPGQRPDHAMDNNPVVYQADNLLMPQCMLPALKVREMRTDCEYLAQVTATSASTDAAMLNYVTIENKGKSNIRRFKLTNGFQPPLPEVEDEKVDEGDNTPIPVVPVVEGNDEEDDDDFDDDFDDEEEHEGRTLLIGNSELNDSIDNDYLYNYSYPRLTSPVFPDDPRKEFTYNDFDVRWRNPRFIGGAGLRQDTIKFQYVVELFRGEEPGDQRAALRSKPVYTHTTKELRHNIPWQDIEELVAAGDYLVLRVRPECVNKGASLIFKGDSVSIVDFALVEHVRKEYFQCSSMVTISDTDPAPYNASELKGKKVAMGQYELTIDAVRNSKTGNGFEGEGRIEWNPLGARVMLAVKFDSLQVNSEMIAVRGLAQTITDPSQASADAVTSIFSDSGIDNLVANNGISFADAVSGSGQNAVAKALGKKAQIGQFYSDIKRKDAGGWFKEGGLMDNVMMPLGMPAAIGNASPVDIQITTFRFTPTWATMDLVGAFQMPGCDWIENDVLMFGAPRLCISPDRILPESGTLALLADFTVTDPKSGFLMTFNAPNDLLYPTDGCYVSWHADAFEMLGVDIDMKIPGLKKVANDVVTNELPNLKIMTSIGNEWEDWMVDKVSMDPFEADDLPGFTFTVSNIVYDHSIYRNSAAMGLFPAGYDRSWLTDGLNAWKGLYIKEVSVKFPKSLEFGDEQQGAARRLALSARNMFFDDSGVTLDAGVDNVISASTGRLGGWSFSLDKVSLRFIQSDFSRCGFSGKVGVPLTDTKIAYNCNIYKQKKGQTTEGYAYIFTTQQVDENMTIDLFLADLNLKKDQTYFVVESVPENGAQVTRVELMMGGTMAIGQTKKQALQSKLNSLPLKISIPDVHFVGLRFSNCRPWQSQFDEVEDLHKASSGAKIAGKQFVSDKTYDFGGGKFFISRGAWSLASMEKKLGSFSFSIDKFSIDQGDNDRLSLSIAGGIGILDEKISAKASVTIVTQVKGLDKAKKLDFSELKVNYVETQFDGASINADFSGMKLNGHLDIRRPTNSDPNRGFGGSLEIQLPGNFLTVGAKGGFYEYDDSKQKFRWGYFGVKVGGEALAFPPVEFTDIHGAFYFNCVKKDETSATPHEGVIGVELGVGLGMQGAPESLNGNCELVIAYDSKANRFSTIRLTGDCHALASKSNPSDGLINAKLMILYENQRSDRYLQISITADASADVSKEVYRQLCGKLPPALADKFSGLMDEFDSKNDNSTTGHKNKSASDNDANAKKIKAEMGAKISLDLRFELAMQGSGYDKQRPSNKCKWHIWVGEPDRDKRCAITFIDFQLGDKSDPIAAWAKLYANMYLCFGNELPTLSNGQVLPDIPSEVMQFLNGNDVSGNKQSLGNSANEKRMDAVNAMMKKSGGGVMVGAEIGGAFGCNAVIAYCDASAVAGFDLVLQKLADDAACNGKGAGKRGWYGVGQAYMMMRGEIGLMLNLWIYEGRLPLVDVGLGALVQAGLPNPTWVYGKLRAKCELFGGLVKFNQSIEFEAGDVCTPSGGSPLDDIQMFGECNPDYETKADGWKNGDNAVDVYLTPRFTTNMKLDTCLKLLENDGGQSPKSRTFKFMLDKVELATYGSASSSNYSTKEVYTASSKDKENWTLNLSSLKPNTYYKLILTGYAQELNTKGQWVNPTFTLADGTKTTKKWTQTTERYFKTGPYPDQLVDGDIGIARPGNSTIGSNGQNAYKCTALYKDEAVAPYLSLKHSRMDLINVSNTSMWMRVEKKNYDGSWSKVVEDTPVTEHEQTMGLKGNQIKYIYWGLPEGKTLNYTPLTGVGNQYRFTILRRNDTAFNNFMANAKEKTRLTRGDGKQQTNSYVTSTSTSTVAAKSVDYTKETVSLKETMQQLSSAAEKDHNADITQERVKQFNSNAKVEEYMKVIYSCEFWVQDYKNAAAHMDAVAGGSFKRYQKDGVNKIIQAFDTNNVFRLYLARFNYIEDGFNGLSSNGSPSANFKTNEGKFRNNPYSMLAYLANYVSFPGVYLPTNWGLWNYAQSTTLDGIKFRPASLYKNIESSSRSVALSKNYMEEARNNAYHSPSYASDASYSGVASKLISDLQYDGYMVENFNVKCGSYGWYTFTDLMKLMVRNDAYYVQFLQEGMISAYSQFNNLSDDTARSKWVSSHSSVITQHQNGNSTINMPFVIPLRQLPVIYAANKAGSTSSTYATLLVANSLVDKLMVWNPKASYNSKTKKYTGEYQGSTTRGADISNIHKYLTGSNSSYKFNAYNYLRSITKLRFTLMAPKYYITYSDKPRQFMYVTDDIALDVIDPFK